jgi:hypothetical protein
MSGAQLLRSMPAFQRVFFFDGEPLDWMATF